MFRSPTLALLMLGATLAVPARAAEPVPPPREGIDYQVLAAPVSTIGAGRIEVAEVFSYRCHFCAAFQPLVNDWKKTMPADVRFEHVPAAFGGSWDDFGRAYYAAEKLGVLEKTHDAVFKAIFVDKSVKTGTRDEILATYAGFGVSPAKFAQAMDSADVTAKLQRARVFAKGAGIDGTPTIILDGKYRIGITHDRSYAGALATLDFLLARERGERAAAAKAH